MQTTMRRPQAALVVPRCPVGMADRHCPRVAGFGTDHPGTGPCRQHELEAAGAARRAAAGDIPQAVFQEAVYVDGLPYEDTAPGMPASPGTCDDLSGEPDDWGYDEQGKFVDLR